MRPRKYQHLGEMTVLRVPNLTASLLPSLIDVMERIEANGQDSVEVIEGILQHLDDTL